MDASADLICPWPLFTDEETKAKSYELITRVSDRLVTAGGHCRSPGSQATLSEHLKAAIDFQHLGSSS